MHFRGHRRRGGGRRNDKGVQRADDREHMRGDMYGHKYSKSVDQPGKVVNPARGQLNREN